MNTNRMSRIMEAREYQKKAIKALLPEDMQEHVDVIENELSAIVKDGAIQLLKSDAGQELMRQVMTMMMNGNGQSGGNSKSNASSNSKEENVDGTEHQDSSQAAGYQACKCEKKSTSSSSKKNSKVKKVIIN